MLRLIHLPSGRCVFEVFDVNVCGRNLPQGKPDPAIFLIAAKELHMQPGHGLAPRTPLPASRRRAPAG
jgi:hypothetical protein